MTQISIMGVLSLSLLLPTVLALPQFWPRGLHVAPYPTMTICSSDGVYPTGYPGTTGTGTGTGTAYYPTGTAYYPTGTAYMIKRDLDHAFGYPAPYMPTGVIPTGMPTGVFPTGTAPSASGTGYPYPTYAPDKRDIDFAHLALRQHFEGPRKRDLHAYYPYEHDYSYGAPTATSPTGTMPMPTGTGTGLPMPSGTGAYVYTSW